MKFKILGFLLLIILIASCDKYSREKYPQFVSKTEKYHYINSCYAAEVGNLNKTPTEMQNKINSYLKNRLGNNNFQKLEFQNCYVLSDKQIEIERSKVKIVF